MKTPKRTKSQIEKEIALLTNSENILGFRLVPQCALSEIDYSVLWINIPRSRLASETPWR